MSQGYCMIFQSSNSPNRKSSHSTRDSSICKQHPGPCCAMFLVRVNDSGATHRWLKCSCNAWLNMVRISTHLGLRSVTMSLETWKRMTTRALGLAIDIRGASLKSALSMVRITAICQDNSSDLLDGGRWMAVWSKAMMNKARCIARGFAAI